MIAYCKWHTHNTANTEIEAAYPMLTVNVKVLIIFVKKRYAFCFYLGLNVTFESSRLHIVNFHGQSS